MGRNEENAGGSGTFNTGAVTKGVTFASDMEWTQATGNDTVRRDKQPLTVHWKTYPKGLCIPLPSKDQTPADIVFDISGKHFAKFKATVGLETWAPGSVQYQVLVDGAPKAESPVLKDQMTHDFSVDVNNGKEVTLRALNCADKSGKVSAKASAAWCFARFVEDGAKDPFEEGP